MHRQLSLSRMESLLVKLSELPTFQAVSANTFECDVSGSCEDPRTVELYARESVGVKIAGRGTFSPAQRGFRRLILTTQCRKCDDCKVRRSRMWYGRAIREWHEASRTWLVSLTFPYLVHVKCENLLRADLALQGLDFDALSKEEKFRLRCIELGSEATLWLKRVRKNSKTRFRYLLVAEAHGGGGANHAMPHFHCLVHEIPGLAPVRKAVMQEAWPYFSNVKLTRDPRGAAYVCKYLSKEIAGRVRPSQFYGDNHQITTLSHSKKSIF